MVKAIEDLVLGDWLAPPDEGKRAEKVTPRVWRVWP